jgi:uncharacterized surface anchored protein
MSDMIAECANGATNHGKFVNCVAHLTNDWKQSGLISEEGKCSIQSCAAKSVTGKVTGSVLEGVTVNLYRSSCGGNQLMDATTTDTDGYFNFRGLSAGDYIIKPVNDTCSFTPEEYTVSFIQEECILYDFSAVCSP